MVYILALSEDCGVPIHLRAASCSTTDDHTPIDTWKLLGELALPRSRYRQCYKADTNGQCLRHPTQEIAKSVGLGTIRART